VKQACGEYLRVDIGDPVQKQLFFLEAADQMPEMLPSDLVRFHFN
jgi:hypothetical protein